MAKVAFIGKLHGIGLATQNAIFVSVNGGDIYNKGMELSLTGKPIVKENFV